ncbi:hypothetical protein [Paraburkholderia podalyriae]|uniref:hypothetical protein n=1 Tax=Paraburkholderia podalyriae TaxID=1938811 RepID=UPI001FECA63E|nr:hypothetical protein [Paraburkholderia podalyriae]
MGAAWMTPEELEVALKWIDERVEGKPYGVDLVFPGSLTALEDDRNPAQMTFADQLVASIYRR